MLKWILCLLLVAPPTLAQTKKRRVLRTYKLSSTLSSWHTLYGYQPLTEGLNTGNQIFAVPKYEFLNELRPEMTFNYRNRILVKAKPTLLYNTFEVEKEPKEDSLSGTHSKADLKELYVDFTRLQNWRIRLGLQTYQWGPAEFYSPSNFLFHFQRESKFFSFIEKGYILGNFIYNFTDSTNMQLLGEVASNADPSWIYEAEFNPRALLKFEHSFSNSFNYLGLTVGQGERKRNSVGLYANFVPFTGFSMYFDGRVTAGETGYHPIAKGGGVVDMTLSENEKDSRSFVVAGLRYEGAFDLRLEGLYFQEGFDQEEYNLWLTSLLPTQPNFPRNLLASNKIGLEMLTKRYYYISLRIPDMGPQKDLSVSLRSLASLESKSQLYTLSMDKPFGGHAVVFLEYTHNTGEKNSEFLLSEQSRAALGIKITYF